MSVPTSCRDGDHITELLDREVLAERLLRASRKHSYDPDTAVDWDAPCDPDLFYKPQTSISIYDTPLWDRLDHRQRVELSRHEWARITSCGIWAELVLMHILASHVYRQPYDTGNSAYALTEIADECRHSTMFARAVRKVGLRTQRGPFLEYHGAKLIGGVYDPIPMFAMILIVEEFTDAKQRLAMTDEAIQPWVRQINRIHVVEEARHVRFAREELTRHTARAGRFRLRLYGAALAVLAWRIADYTLDPAGFRAVGLDPRDAVRSARASAHRRAHIQFAYRKLTALFAELGLIDGFSARIWRRLGLLPGG